jgi:Domain of unknown function DUF11
VLAAALAAGLVVPAAAHAASDIGISETASSTKVKPGTPVTVNVTATNLGDQASPTDSVYLDIFSWGAHGRPTDNPYQSVAASQGSCNIKPVGEYQDINCNLGPLSPGASAQITAVVQANETADHFTQLLGENYTTSAYGDDNASNNKARTTIYAASPVVTGSKKLKISGLPDVCASEDFNLQVKANTTRLKKLVASASLGVDDHGIGIELRKTVHRKRLTARVPVSRMAEYVLGKEYELKIEARRRGGGKLKATVKFEHC